MLIKLKHIIIKNKKKNLKVNLDHFSLTKQREYTDYISGAKRELIKRKRFEKMIAMILNGIVLHVNIRIVKLHLSLLRRQESIVSIKSSIDFCLH
ncbi:hypothetical protein BTO04_01635 [Polaribacter sp. SA4-10]|uniref:YdeI/OmpD-associated family protein n=1 Tax=Polaribacter sp. SA4-10 TaxID=754397 RepID=UPI000B3C92D8|nr:YdeI/OmpD-associated family protein [Polaribacter sp. SA4-10]ARV05472.1 hypothetical protein BTO04_01635 [Polaribacter sp. SA4-10]